jgi:putative ABC transport system permease protein
MLKNYLKIAIRNLLKGKTFSLINISGFAIGISVCLMIMLFLLKEHSYDNYHANAGRLYKVIDSVENSSSIDYRIRQRIMDNYAEVTNACYVMVIPSPIGVYYKNDKKENSCYIDNLMSADNAFFEMFTTYFIYGNKSKPLPDLNSAVITESAARQIFGEGDPLGKEITIRNAHRVVISAVINDFPDNSSINANIIVNAENNQFKFYYSCENSNDSSTYRYLFNNFLLIKDGIDVKQFVAKINSHPEILSPYTKKIDLVPLRDIYLSDNSTGCINKKGNPPLLNLMTIIALIVLILAVINYVNLTVAQQNKRNKEIGIRKTVGASRKDIMYLFLSESVCVAILSFLLAVIIVDIGMPYFNAIVDGTLSLSLLLNFPLNIILPIAVILIGILSGILPASLLSSFNPLKAMKGATLTSGRKNGLRKILTVFQFTVSIALIFSIIVIKNQIYYVKHKDLGFDKDQFLYLNLPRDSKKISVLHEKLIQYPNIKSISATMGVPGKINLTMGSAIEGKNKSISIIAADSAFLSTFNIQLIKGRQFLPGDDGKVCMINESAYKYFEWDNLENKRYNNGREGGFEVIGVVKDFHITSLHKAIEPAVILFYRNWSANCLNIRIAGGAIGQTIENIQKTWKEILPDYPLQYNFYDDWFDAMYKKEDSFAKLIGLFALLAISISCMGILGLAIFSSESRTKEIGIRKVVGAGVFELISMLNRDFVKWVIIAFVIASPIAWYTMNKWLQDFAYRTEISWWLFALSGFIALSIALLTVSWQTWKAATANPIESLKYE